MSTLKNLLTSVAKLEETKPNNQLKSLYSSKGRNEAEAERSEVLDQIDLPSSDDEQFDDEVEKDQDDFTSKKGSSSQASNPKKSLISFLEKKNQGNPISCLL